VPSTSSVRARPRERDRGDAAGSQAHEVDRFQFEEWSRWQVIATRRKVNLAPIPKTARAGRRVCYAFPRGGAPPEGGWGGGAVWRPSALPALKVLAQHISHPAVSLCEPLAGRQLRSRRRCRTRIQAPGIPPPGPHPRSQFQALGLIACCMAGSGWWGAPWRPQTHCWEAARVLRPNQGLPTSRTQRRRSDLVGLSTSYIPCCPVAAPPRGPLSRRRPARADAVHVANQSITLGIVLDAQCRWRDLQGATAIVACCQLQRRFGCVSTVNT